MVASRGYDVNLLDVVLADVGKIEITEGHPKGSCQTNGSAHVAEVFSEEFERRGLLETVRLTGTFCMGPCDRGPTVVVYPEGVWYGGVQASDVPEIVENHLGKGQPVSRLRIG